MKKILVIIILFCIIANNSFARNNDSKKTLYIIKRLSPAAENLGFKVGDIFIDNFNNKKLKMDNYAPEAFDDNTFNKCGYNLGNYDKYIKTYTNSLDRKLLYRQFNEFETRAMGNFVLTEEISDKKIYNSIKWGIGKYDEAYCDTIKEFFVQWFNKEKEKMNPIHRNENIITTNEQKENDKYSDIEAFMNDNSAWEKESKAFLAQAEKEFKESEAKRKKELARIEARKKAELKARLQKEQDERKRRLEDRANREPTLGEKQAFIKAQSYLNNVGGFSRSGMIKQLEFEGFSYNEAEYAVDMLGY